MNRVTRNVIPILALAVSLFAVTGASAQVIPTIESSLTQGKTDSNSAVVPDGIDSSAETPDTKLGNHADFNVDMRFSYGATGLTSMGVEDPATYPAGQDYRETVSSIVTDIPPGLVGNPNAVPYDERCDISTFETGDCPASATVGEIWVKYSIMDFFPEIGYPSALSLNAVGPKSRTGYENVGSGYTTVSLLKTSPEVPALIGLYVRGPIGYLPLRIKLKIDPLTNEDLRLRAVTTEGIPSKVSVRQVDEEDNIVTVQKDYRLERMKLKLYGKLANGHNFMTSPTSCQSWKTSAWVRAHYSNENTVANPLGTGQLYAAPRESTITPDCTNRLEVPFNANGKVSLSTPRRDDSPDFDFEINNPGIQGDGQAATGLQKVIATIPASINVDVQQLSRNCTAAQFAADACSPGSRVGNVRIETPLISAGLTGDVYLVKKDVPGLPDIGLRVRGAITFTQRGTTRYVGDKNNQIETTFDNIPQVGFSRLQFHLDGGPTGLLRTLACPTYNKEPAVPSFSYTFTSWTGVSNTTSTPLNIANCFGIQKLKSYRKCLHQTLPVHPDYQSRTRVKRVTLKVDGKQKAQRKNSPFRFDLPIKKLKLKQRKSHKLELRAVYDDGTISKKQTKFKVCKR